MQIGQLKEKIRDEKGHPVDSQKIIFKGKTTTNEETIEKLNLKETDFLVVMTQVAVLLNPFRNLSPNLKLKRNLNLPNKNRKRRKRKRRRRRLLHPHKTRRMKPKSTNLCPWASRVSSASPHSEPPSTTPNALSSICLMAFQLVDRRVRLAGKVRLIQLKRCKP